MRKNKKKFEGSVQSATRGEWLRARQMTLIVARLPKERLLTSCSRLPERVIIRLNLNVFLKTMRRQNLPKVTSKMLGNLT